MAIVAKRATQDVSINTQSATALQGPDQLAGIEGRALQSVGRAVQQSASAINAFAVAEKKRTQIDELHAATISDADSYASFVNEQSNNPDYRTDVDSYEKWRQGNDDRALESFTDNEAKGEFKRQLEVKNIQRTAAVKEFQRSRHKQDIIGNMDEMLAGFARVPDNVEEVDGVVTVTTGEDTGNAYITGLREGGWISGAQENQFQAALSKSINNQKLLTAEQAVNDAVINVAVAAEAEKEGSGWQVTQKWLNDPDTAKLLVDEFDMTLDEVGSVLADVKAQASLANADKVSREEQSQSEETNDVWKKINDKEFTGIEDFINAQPNLTEVQKGALIAKSESRAKAINAGKVDPFEETNSQVYFDTLTKIDTMTDAKLQALTGKGLSIADYEKFKGMLEKDSSLNRPSSKRSQAAIARIRDADIAATIKEEDAKGFDALDIEIQAEQDYLGIQNELDDWIALNADDPDFDTKLELKTQQLLEPAIEAVTLSLFQRTFAPFPEKLLANRRFNAFKKTEEFENLTEEQQNSVKGLFDRGLTQDQVVNEIASGKRPTSDARRKQGETVEEFLKRTGNG